MALAYLVLKIVYEIRLHHWSHEIKLIKTGTAGVIQLPGSSI